MINFSNHRPSERPPLSWTANWLNGWTVKQQQRKVKEGQTHNLARRNCITVINLSSFPLAFLSFHPLRRWMIGEQRPTDPRFLSKVFFVNRTNPKEQGQSFPTTSHHHPQSVQWFMNLLRSSVLTHSHSKLSTQAKDSPSLSYSLLLQCTQNNNVKNEPLHHPLIIMLERIQSLFWVNNSSYPFTVSYSLIKIHTTWPLATTESSRDDGPEAVEEKSAWYEKSPPLSVSFFFWCWWMVVGRGTEESRRSEARGI